MKKHKGTFYEIGWKSPILFLVIYFSCCFAFSIAGSLAAAQDKVPPKATLKGIVPGRYIVVLRDRVQNASSTAKRMEKAHRFRLRHVYQRALKGFCAQIPESELSSVERDPDVAFVEPDRRVYAVAQLLPTGIDRIEADHNPIANINGVDERVDVDVAVIDTGVDLDHPDLYVFQSTNCARWQTGCSGNGEDYVGHGSHVAGTIGALDNGIGVVGVAPGARIWAVRTFNKSGTGYVSWLIKGIDWVTAHAEEIEVANMSVSWMGYSQAAHQAIQNSVKAGVVYFAAAGNDGTDVYGANGTYGDGDDVCPACFPEVAAVSALSDTDGAPGGEGQPSSYGADDSFASFSNYSESVVTGNPVDSPGAAIDLMCPGVDIRSTTKNGQYATYSGTSMASPHAAGLAALYIAQNERAENAQGVYDIRQALIDHAVSQTAPDGLALPNDPDDNPEPIGWAGEKALQRDIAISSITTEPSSPVVWGEPVLVHVTVRNVGNEVVPDEIVVALFSDNAGGDGSIDMDFGTQTVSALSAGESKTVDFPWPWDSDINPGVHTLTASLTSPSAFYDQNPDNDTRSSQVEVREQAAPNTLHIESLTGSSANMFWGIWKAEVKFKVVDFLGAPVNQATVSGTFSDGPTLFKCTTGVNGACSVLGYQMWLDCLTFTVSDVTHQTLDYDPYQDDDKEPNLYGTNITVCRP
jgi:subtilisin